MKRTSIFSDWLDSSGGMQIIPKRTIKNLLGIIVIPINTEGEFQSYDLTSRRITWDHVKLSFTNAIIVPSLGLTLTSAYVLWFSRKMFLH